MITTQTSTDTDNATHTGKESKGCHPCLSKNVSKEPPGGSNVGVWPDETHHVWSGPAWV
jgi:hypothetical protein